MLMESNHIAFGCVMSGVGMVIFSPEVYVIQIELFCHHFLVYVMMNSHYLLNEDHQIHNISV